MMKFAPLLGVCLLTVASVSLRNWDWDPAQRNLKGDHEAIVSEEAAYLKEADSQQETAHEVTAELLLEEVTHLKETAAQQKVVRKNLILASKMQAGSESIRLWLARVVESSRLHVTILRFVFLVMKGYRFEDRNSYLQQGTDIEAARMPASVYAD